MQALLDQKMTLKGKNVTILGAGGAARAIAVECALAGASSVLIVNRTEERAIELADVIQKNTSAKALWQKWEGSLRIPSNTDLLVNATSIGLHPDSDSLPPVDYDTIHAGMTVSDVVFKSGGHAFFLQKAAKRGAKTVNGLGMLARQGALNFYPCGPAYPLPFP